MKKIFVLLFTVFAVCSLAQNQSSEYQRELNEVDIAKFLKHPAAMEQLRGLSEGERLAFIEREQLASVDTKYIIAKILVNYQFLYDITRATPEQREALESRIPKNLVMSTKERLLIEKNRQAISDVITKLKAPRPMDNSSGQPPTPSGELNRQEGNTASPNPR